ncbi:hypothetical protein [Streptomyces yatensis]|nr:hypothetical protein [Streptomyces yatensis]
MLHRGLGTARRRGTATDSPALLALGVGLITVGFGLGQPAMMSAVDEP